jgi:hypothetical protein
MTSLHRKTTRGFIRVGRIHHSFHFLLNGRFRLVRALCRFMLRQEGRMLT